MADNDVSVMFAGLVRTAQLLVDRIVAKTSTGEYPKGESRPDATYTSIGAATRIGSPQKDGVNFYIDVIIDQTLAPYAAAYEWGSGLHGAKGETYVIAARNAPALAFMGWNPREPMGALLSKKSAYSHKEQMYFARQMLADDFDASSFLWKFSYVDHPGVARKPYIRPSLYEISDDIEAIFGKAVMQLANAILGPDTITIEVRL